MDNNKDKKTEVIDKIEWIGLDGLLVLGYFVLVALMFCTLYFKLDILMGWVFPIALLTIVLFVTINYARTLKGFIKMQNESIKKGTEQSK